MDLPNLPAWFDHCCIQMNNFLELENNWDSYGGAPASQDAVDTAQDLLRSISHDNLIEPYIIPMASGGIQIEWCEKKIQLEIEITKEKRIYILYDLMEEGNIYEEYEGEVFDYSLINSVLKHLENQ